MKQTTTLFLLLLLFASCQHKEVQQKATKTIICGKISNFEKVAKHDFIQIEYFDIISDFIELSEPIDNKGEFRFEFHHEIPIELMVDYGKRLSFYASPGDSLYFDIDGTCRLKKLNSYKEAYSYYQVSGTADKINKDVSAYTAFYHDSLRAISSAYSQKIRNCSPTEYKAYMDSVEQEVTKQVAAFNELTNTCNEFKVWVQKEIKYEKWFHLFRYPWQHPWRNNIDYKSFILNLPDEYFDFVNWGDGEFKENLVSKYYMEALKEFYNTTDLIKWESIEDKEKIEEPTLAADTMKNIFLQYDNPFERDILITKFYCRSLNNKQYQTIKDIFNPSLIKDDWLRYQLVKKFESEKRLYENPEFKSGTNLNQLAAENDFLNELIKKYPDKVIYLDFWATWCKPCMKEFPHAASVKKQLEGRDIVFVYLASHCKEDAWKSTIAEKNIKGEHYLLTGKQYALLSDVLSIRGFPHFAIIDKEGKVLHHNAPGPSNIDKLMEIFEDILM